MGKVRITSGTFRGRTLETPGGKGTRPLLTRLRKSLADLLRPGLPGARILDLFGGSGAIALELLSNGGRNAVIVEMEPSAAELIQRNVAALEVDAEVLVGDALRVLPSLSARGDEFDLVIIAPPYGHNLQTLAIGALASARVLAPGGLVVVQREQSESAVRTDAFRLEKTRRYGRTVFDFYLIDAP